MKGSGRFLSMSTAISKAIALFLCMTLAGCGWFSPVGAGKALASVAGDVEDAVAEVAEALPPPKPPQPVALLPTAALDLLVGHEIGSPATYTKRYESPVWPGGPSGATWCIGYDAGHQSRGVILSDWYSHFHRERLAATAGIKGQPAKALIPGLKDIRTPYAYCRVVFDTVSIVKYYRIAQRSFGRGFGAADPMVQGVLTDLVYNRGGSMTGDRRREMRTIRDECLPRQDVDCIIVQLNSMLRLWAGQDIERTMRRRTNDRVNLLKTLT